MRSHGEPGTRSHPPERSATGSSPVGSVRLPQGRDGASGPLPALRAGPPAKSLGPSDSGPSTGLQRGSWEEAESRPTPPPELVAGLRLLQLPSREATAYLTLGRLGPSEVGRLAGAVQLHRATTYRVVSRLIRRGLVAGDGRRPQRYASLPADVLLRRLAASLRECEELVLAMAEIYARWGSCSPTVAPDGGSWLIPPPTHESGFGSHPVLRLLAMARHRIDAVFPSSVVGPRYRSGLLGVLTRAARVDVRVRVVTDASLSGRRFERGVHRETIAGPGSIDARHFTPGGAHFYLVDERILLRFPTLPRPGSFLETAVATNDPNQVLTQRARFETLWSESVRAPTARRRSARPWGSGGGRAVHEPPMADTAGCWRAA